MPSKKEMQQAYRLKETQGFADLHHALYAVNPQLPIRRDVPRYQLLLMAADQIRRMADDRQQLTHQLTYPPPNTPPQDMYYTTEEVANFEESSETYDHILNSNSWGYLQDQRHTSDCTSFATHPYYQSSGMMQHMGGMG